MPKPLSYQIEEEDEASLINLTPLLDVLFVVLIMFILIAPIVDLDLDRITLAPSGTEQSQTPYLSDQARPIKIYVHSDNTLWLGKHHLTLPQLQTTLQELYKIYPKEIPELYQDQNAYFGSYQKVKNAVEGAGFAQLDVVLKDE
jgi:biopolymer transport protein ExbD